MRQGVSFFLIGRMNIYDEGRSDRPFVVSDDLFGKLMKRSMKIRSSQSLNNSHKFLGLFCMKYSHRKVRLPVLCSVGTKNSFWKYNKWLCLRLSFMLRCGKRRIFLQNCNWQWDLAVLHKRWDNITVNNMRP